MEFRNTATALLLTAILPLISSSSAQMVDTGLGGQNTVSSPSGGTRTLRPGGALPISGGEAVTIPADNSISAPLSISTPADLPALDVNGMATPADGESVDSDAGFKKWRFAPIAGVGYVYDNNILITHTNPVGSQIFKVTAGVSVDYGDFKAKKDSFLTFDYLGVGSIYEQMPAQNTYNDGYILKAQYTMQKLRILLESAYTYFNGANVQSGTFTKSTTLNNSLHAFYQYSDKTSFDCAIQQITKLYPTELNSYDNQVKLGFNYQTTEKLKLGMDAILGVNPSQNSPTRTYQTLNGRFQYTLTDKLDVKGTVGVQASEFQTGGAPLRVTPVFSIGTDYKPFTPTTVSLLLYRNYNNSPIYSAQNYLATGLNFNVSQQIYNHWSFGLGVNYENDVYIANQSGVVASRKDNTFSIRPTVTYSFLKYLQASIYYQNSYNDSTFTSFSWSDNQYGIELKTAF